MVESQHQARGQFAWNPDTYSTEIRADVPRYDELQEQAVAAIPFAPARVLELGVGTGETTQRILKRHPDAELLGLDSSSEMAFRARELGIDVQLARMEDPLPDGPWDLVIGVLSVHHLRDPQKQDLFRRVREHSRSLVVGDVVAVPEPIAPIDPDYDFPSRTEDLAEWCDGEVVWAVEDLAVVRAVYD